MKVILMKISIPIENEEKFACKVKKRVQTTEERIEEQLSNLLKCIEILKEIVSYSSHERGNVPLDYAVRDKRS